MLNVSSKKSESLPNGPAASRWGIAAALLLVIPGFLLAQILAQIVVSLIPSFLGWDAARATTWLEQAPLASFIYVLLAESLIISLIVWFVRRKKTGFWQAVGFRRPRWLDAAAAVAGFLGYAAIYAVMLVVVSNIFPLDADQEQAVGFSHSVRGAGLAMAFISLVILPPLVEEILFRGFLFGTLRRRNISFIWSTLVVSGLFGLMHLFGGSGNAIIWIAFLDTFVLSLVLCYLRERTGSIWASIGLHALKNTIVFLNLFIISGR